MDNVLCIWPPFNANGRRNLGWALDTGTWGFKRAQAYAGRPIEWVLFGYNHTARQGPRTDDETWRGGSLDLTICEFTRPFYVSDAPHWQDEVAQSAVIYPFRIGIAPVTFMHGVSVGAAETLDDALGEGLRRAGSSNQGILVSADIDPLLRAAGVTRREGAPIFDAGWVTVDVKVDGSGPGRSSDPEFNRAVEQHAVKLATSQMEQLGWRVEPLGKPYDLVCTKDDSPAEKHVEVKGTTGSGAEVNYTPNEVKHFRECPWGADLIVVSNIKIDRKGAAYRCSGGNLSHTTNYTAPNEDLRPSGWIGRVPTP